MEAIVNHVGQVVADLARSRRFYEEALGFVYWREIRPPDDMVARLNDLPAPLGVTAVYLRLGGFVLELIAYADASVHEHAGCRVMNDLGLTRLSVSVDDVDAAAARVVEHGGTVLEATHVGAVVLVRDPDGQLVELVGTPSGASR
ncbi:MAG: hypothetical protein AMXMBFR46_13200 [Acidimicrobiia bacterium]